MSNELTLLGGIEMLCPVCDTVGSYMPGCGMYCVSCMAHTIEPKEELKVKTIAADSIEYGSFRRCNGEVYIHMVFCSGDYPNRTRTEYYLSWNLLNSLVLDAAKQNADLFENEDDGEEWKQSTEDEEYE